MSDSPSAPGPLSADEAEAATEDETIAWLKRNISWMALAFALLFFLAPHFSIFGPLDAVLSGPQRASEWSLRKLQQLFKNYGYYVVFFGVFLENSMFLGFLVPGSVILILGGLAAQNGSINISYVLALAVAATIAGDTMSYGIGRMGWTRILERATSPATVAKMRDAMEKNRWIIVAYHWAGYSRAVGPAAAGLFRIPFRIWAPLDYGGGAVWAIAYVMLGVVLGLFGVEFGDTKVMLRLIEILFTALLVGGILIAWYRTSRSTPPEGSLESVLLPVEEE